MFMSSRHFQTSSIKISCFLSTNRCSYYPHFDRDTYPANQRMCVLCVRVLLSQFQSSHDRKTAPHRHKIYIQCMSVCVRVCKYRRSCGGSKTVICGTNLGIYITVATAKTRFTSSCYVFVSLAFFWLTTPDAYQDFLHTLSLFLLLFFVSYHVS